MTSCVRAAVAVAVLVSAEFATPVRAAVIAYYSFDSESLGMTPDLSGNGHELTLGGATPATIVSDGMFGSALNSTAVTGYAQLADGDPDFDTAYTSLSVGLWAKNETWSGTGYGQRFLTGKFATGDNRGWNMNVVGGSAIGQIQFVGYRTNVATEGNDSVITTFSSPLDPAVFHHFMGTFDAAGEMRLYVDGILAASITPTIPQINGNNTNNFQVINRGLTATNPASGGGFIGSIDDYVLSTDSISPQEVALIHGLGRLAGVAWGAPNAAMTGTQILDVLAAYNSQGSAMAGAKNWHYGASVGAGPIGTIGGSVAGNNAFIVLGADGSGVRLNVPGDFDGDGDVDGADFVAWQTNFPKPAGALLNEGDADGDGDVDGADFVVWQTNFPYSPSPATSPIPEPAAIILIACGAFTAIFVLRRTSYKPAYCRAD